MEWIEADPLPVECEICQEAECYNCDYAMKRWYLSEEGEQRMRLIVSKLKNKEELQIKY